MYTEPWNTPAHLQVALSAVDADVFDFGQFNPYENTDQTAIKLVDTSSFGNHIQGDATLSQESRRPSTSSVSLSSRDPLADVPQSDEFSSSMIGSERLSLVSGPDHWNSLGPSLNVWSPVTSHRNSFQESMRSSPRSRASPTPHTNVRSSPYPVDSERNKRWSTGMYAPSLTPQRTVPNYTSHRHSCFYGLPLKPVNYATGDGAIQATNPPSSFHPAVFSQPSFPTPPEHTLFSSPAHAFTPKTAHQLPSQGLFPLLQSNADQRSGYSSHFADLADAPDLFSSLEGEAESPPEEDLNPSDPDLIPYEQDLRFTGDLYTPRWVRGHGNRREGWCGLCKPGRWLVLKNSAFWYDKSFTHGVSAVSGAAFQRPQDTRKIEANLDVWEGLCGSCGDWIALVSSKKKGTTWFRHAYKCHTHQKVKDGPKRKREVGKCSRARPASMARPEEPKMTEVQ